MLLSSLTDVKKQSPSKHPLPYRPDIDGLRAIAILAVVIFHAFPSKLPGGFIGVDIFFVISGFLISSLIFKDMQAGAFSFQDFYARRINRIFPALILVLATSAVFAWFALLPDEFKQFSQHVANSAGFMQNFALWAEAGYFDSASELKPLMHLWSLSIEEQFYLLYPLLIWAAWRAGLNIFWTVLALGLLSFGLNIAGIHTDLVQAFFAPQSRLWELVAGAMLACMQIFPFEQIAGRFNSVAMQRLVLPVTRYTQRHAIALNNLCSVVGLSLIIGALYGLDKEKSFPGWWALLPVAGAFLLILSGPQTWFSRHVLANRVMVFIGAISYPLYLWHWPLLSFTQIIDSEMTPRGRNMAFLASFLLAWLTYRFLEKPLRALGKSALKTATLCIMLTLLAALGLASLQQDGAAMREHAAISQRNPFDFPYKGSCAKLMHAEFGDDWCNEGNAGLRAPNTVLIGDSFSNAYADMLTEYAHNEKINPPVFRQFGRGQCPALLDYGPLACRQITFAAADYIRDTPAVGTVIIAAHWHAYFSGKKYPVPEQKETAESFYRAFTQTIEFYQGLGKRVVVFLAPPTGANPRSCIPRPVYLGKNNICNLSADEARKNDGLYRERLLPYLAERKVAIFDPFKVLCEAGNCKLMEQDRILYNDLYHLSRFGGQFLARSGREQLDQALQAPKLP